jgi:hypothetical protein
MRKTFLAIMAFFAIGNLYAKVPVKSVVEHFTNTKCSICANRNPGFFSNLNSTTGFYHISIFPSAPYSSCPLSIQNKIDADARTNFYSVYGGTPRLVINGSVIPSSANYALPALFTPYQNLTSSFQIKAVDVKFGVDSIQTMVTIIKVDTSSMLTAKLFVGLFEDTVFINGGNGETKHYNVFRKASTTPQGNLITLPALVGDSVVLKFSSMVNIVWDFNRIYSFALLQNPTSQQLIQSEKSTLASASTGINSNMMNALNISVFPNPCAEYLKINAPQSGNYTLEIFATDGKKMLTKTFENSTTIQTVNFPIGTYILKTTNQNHQSNIQKIYVTK